MAGHDLINLVNSEEPSTDLLKDDTNWFKIWVISTVIIFGIEFYLDQRQLRNFYQTMRPKSIEKYLDQKKFKKCQEYSKAKKQFAMFCSWNDFVFELAFWMLGFPPAIWMHTAPLSESWAKGDDGKIDPVDYDFW